MRTTRRAAVAGSGAAALGLAACTRDDPGASSDPPASSPTASSSTAEDPPADPDRAALERAAALTTALLDIIAGAGPGVDRTGELRRLHLAHLAALEEISGAVASSTLPPARPRATRTRLRAKELQAQRELAALAARAGSGLLARLLASMSAGVAAAVSRPGQAAR